MGRFRASADEDSDAPAIDISPLMDCVFILLIFFIVTTTFNEEPGVEVDKASAVSSERLAKTSILIAVTAEDEVVYGGKSIGVGGVQALVRRELKKNEDLPVAILVDRNSSAEVPQMVVAEARRAGAKKTSIATRREP
jgi:biopolymer transport protein ExbD